MTNIEKKTDGIRFTEINSLICILTRHIHVWTYFLCNYIYVFVGMYVLHAHVHKDNISS